MKKLVYVAGPYSSHPVHNTRTAVLHAMMLWETGTCVPFIPHLTLLADLIGPRPVSDWYTYDDDILAHCDALWRLAGFSPGADREVALAEEFAIPVFHALHEVIAWAGTLS